MKPKEKRSIWLILVCTVFLTFTAAFFLPLREVLRSFLFPFSALWPVMLLISCGIAVMLCALLILLPARVGRIAASVVFGIGLAVFAQEYLMSNEKGFQGKIEMGATWPGQMLNLYIWFGIVLITVVMFVRLSKEKEKQTRLITGMAAGILTVFQLVMFLIMATTTDPSVRKADQYLSGDGKFELSARDNTIVFVLDSADETYFTRMLEKYPELNYRLSGWEYYGNTTSEYSRSYPAITYMLTGEKCWFDKKPEDYINGAFYHSDFLRRLNQQGTDIRVFTKNPEMIGSSAAEYIANSSLHAYTIGDNLDMQNLLINLGQIALNRSAPYLLKAHCSYDPDEVYKSSYKDIEQPGPAFTNYIEPDYYTALLNEKISISDQYQKAFRFYHLWGTQPGYFWNQDLAGVGDVAPEDALRGSVLAVEVYALYLRELGIFDDATIIVTSGNGSSGGNSGTLDVPAAACPILLVKYPHSDMNQQLIKNTAPVSQEDLFATIETTLGLDVSGTGSGKTLKDIREGEDRTRYYYYSSLYSNEDGEIALREYEIRGDANDINNWRATGKWWDIDYSLNLVSPTRFSGN